MSPYYFDNRNKKDVAEINQEQLGLLRNRQDDRQNEDNYPQNQQAEHKREAAQKRQSEKISTKDKRKNLLKAVKELFAQLQKDEAQEQKKQNIDIDDHEIKTARTNQVSNNNKSFLYNSAVKAARKQDFDDDQNYQKDYQQEDKAEKNTANDITKQIVALEGAIEKIARYIRYRDDSNSDRMRIIQDKISGIEEKNNLLNHNDNNTELQKPKTIKKHYDEQKHDEKIIQNQPKDDELLSLANIIAGEVSKSLGKSSTDEQKLQREIEELKEKFNTNISSKYSDYPKNAKDTPLKQYHIRPTQRHSEGVELNLAKFNGNHARKNKIENRNHPEAEGQQLQIWHRISELAEKIDNICKNTANFGNLKSADYFEDKINTLEVMVREIKNEQSKNNFLPEIGKKFQQIAYEINLCKKGLDENLAVKTQVKAIIEDIDKMRRYIQRNPDNQYTDGLQEQLQQLKNQFDDNEQKNSVVLKNMQETLVRVVEKLNQNNNGQQQNNKHYNFAANDKFNGNQQAAPQSAQMPYAPNQTQQAPYQPKHPQQTPYQPKQKMAYPQNNASQNHIANNNTPNIKNPGNRNQYPSQQSMAMNPNINFQHENNAANQQTPYNLQNPAYQQNPYNQPTQQQRAQQQNSQMNNIRMRVRTADDNSEFSNDKSIKVSGAAKKIATASVVLMVFTFSGYSFYEYLEKQWQSSAQQNVITSSIKTKANTNQNNGVDNLVSSLNSNTIELPHGNNEQKTTQIDRSAPTDNTVFAINTEISDDIVQTRPNNPQNGREVVVARPTASKSSTARPVKKSQLANQNSLTWHYDRAIRLLAADENSKDALTHLQKSAAGGLPVAQYKLALFYENGKNVPQSKSTAKILYEKSASQGNVYAMHNLGVLLAEQDKQGNIDFSKAKYWFEKAAEFGFTDSQYNLAVLYERGLGVPPDKKIAYKWYAIAAASDDEAANKRDDLAQQLNSDELTGAAKLIAKYQSRKPIEFANKSTSARQSSNTAQDTRAAIRPSQLVKDVQKYLYGLGYEPGPFDGIAGPQTIKAVKDFQRQYGLIANGAINDELLQVISTAADSG